MPGSFSPADWLRRALGRADAWACLRQDCARRAEALALDRYLRANWPRVLGGYAAAIVPATVGLYLVKSRLGWLPAFLAANLLALCAVVLFLSAWYGWRKWTGKRARRTFAVFFASMVAGAAAVLALDALRTGRAFPDMAPEKVSTLAGSILLMAVVAMALLMGIVTLRRREDAQRMALLQADAVRERLERQGIQARLKLLQAQVEPHFLFNTLANVRYLVQSGSGDALPMLDHLIHYLRTALPEIRADGSTLGREAQLAGAYLEILRLRMGGALAVTLDVPEALASLPFPPLMLMTLVENAIKHGVGPVGHGSVTIAARESDGRIRVTVEDDGRGIGGELGRGVGLANARERLAALHGDAARLVLAAREGGGTRATIEVPAP